MRCDENDEEEKKRNGRAFALGNDSKILGTIFMKETEIITVPAAPDAT